MQNNHMLQGSALELIETMFERQALSIEQMLADTLNNHTEHLLNFLSSAFERADVDRKVINLKQREAYRFAGEGNIKRWVASGKLERKREGYAENSPVYYSLTDILQAYMSECPKHILNTLEKQITRSLILQLGVRVELVKVVQYRRTCMVCAVVNGRCIQAMTNKPEGIVGSLIAEYNSHNTINQKVALAV